MTSVPPVQPPRATTPDASKSTTQTEQEDELTLTVHAMPRAHVPAADSADDARRRRWGRIKMIMVLLLCAAPVIASYLTYFVVRPEGRTNYADLITPPRDWPVGLTLKDLQGQEVTPRSLRRQWLLVAMVNGPCDAACENQLLAQRQLREMLGRERERVDKVVIVLDDHVLDARTRDALLAPPQAQILRAPSADLASALGVPATALRESLYVVDPNGMWMMRTPPVLEPSKFKRDLERLLRASASWDRAGRVD